MPNHSNTTNDPAYLQYMRVFAMGFSAFIFNTTEFVPVGILSDIAQSFSMSNANVGWMITIYAWVVACLSLPLMLLTQRIERKTLLLLVFSVFIISHLLSAFAWSFNILVISRIGVALAHAVFWSITASIAIRCAPEGKRTLALSVLGTGTSLAMVLGVPLGRLIDQCLGWQATFATIGMTAFILMLILMKILPTLPSLSIGVAKKLPTLIKNPILLGSYLFIFLIFSAHYTTYSYIEPFLQNIGQIKGYSITFILLLFGGAGIIGSIIFNYLGEKRSTALLIVSTLIILVSTASLALIIHQHFTLYFLMIAWSAAVMLIILAAQIKILHIDHNAFEIIMSMFSGIINLGIGAGAMIGGHIIVSLGLSSVGYISALIALLALSILLLLLYKYPSFR